MLDGWWRGRSERMSREAPAPVVEITDRIYAPGGAANTAMNLAALGARVRLVGIAGQDQAGEQLRAQLDSAGIDIAGLRLVAEVRTVTKDRILSADQMLVRVDDVSGRELPRARRDDLGAALGEALPGSDAVVVCDYGSGTLLPPVGAALARGPRPPLVVVDAHHLGAWAPIEPDLVTPNAGEAFRLLSQPVPAAGRAESIIAEAASLKARSGAAAVVVTLDRDGAVTLDADGTVHRTSAQAVSERQAAGAGDTFVAALTLARAGGLDLGAAGDLAQAAADVAVRQFGTSVCTTEDLVEHLGRFGDPALEVPTLLARLREHRAAGRRVVVTNGCFDVLHRGHTTYLAQAARLGDVLVVAVNSDDSVRRLKGPDRPINSAADRAGVLAALSCVDYVTVFATDTPIPLLQQIRPEVYVKGGDYTAEMLAEAEIVRAYGGEVRILDYVTSHSTTAVVARIRSGPTPVEVGE
jgi:rfaE bifunctional protein kinase chain/domain/rfaE bifunctional protein nucleotidyltransferase chain/domain